MTTRLKRRAIWRPLLITCALLAFQGYLGYSVVTGQFGVESREVLEAEIKELEAKSGALAAEIDSYRHRVELFTTTKLDPDILSERARSLLAMAQPDDIVVMVHPSGKPIGGSYDELAADKLTGIIEDGID